MSELQLPRRPSHPALQSTAYVVGVVSLAALGITMAAVLAAHLDWIGEVPWAWAAVRALLPCIALADALHRLSMIRPGSLTRRMHQVGSVVIPGTLAFAATGFLPARAALAPFLVFGAAYTLDTQSGLPAWSRDRWVATAGSLGFPLFFVGAVLVNYPALLASWPLLMMALGSGMQLHMRQPPE